jgi:hypothetical protein
MTAPARMPPAAADTTLLVPEWAPAPPRRVYFLALRHWAFIFVVASLLTAVSASTFAYDSPWVGVGVWAAVVVTLHTAFVARTLPWIPGLIAIIALLQWVLASWAGYHVPAPLSTLAMAIPADEYFSYAVPATLLFIIGLYLPLWRLGRTTPLRTTPSMPRDFVRTCDIMIGVGLVATVAQTFAIPFSLRYAVVLVEYLAFVGAFGLALAQADGWGWRLAAVLGIRAIVSTNDGTFQELLLWSGYAFVLLAFLFRWRARTIAMIGVVALVALGAVNEIKVNYRMQLSENIDLGVGERVEALGRAFGQQIEDPLAPFKGASLSRTVTRVNQGWIISRTMYWTPVREPFAHGETLITAIHAVLVPRIVDANKYMAGGYNFFTRFTGMRLRGTSMNLSAPGEMYANFGRTGGLIGVFGLALCLGMLYGLFARWAMDSPLWWAWAPYVMLYTMQAETGVGEGLNHVARSFLIMIIVISVAPAWMSLRRRSVLLRVQALRRAHVLSGLMVGPRRR